MELTSSGILTLSTPSAYTNDMRTALVMALDEQPGDGIETFVFLISPDIRERGSDVAVMGTVRHERGIA